MKHYEGFLIDLDGTIYRGKEEIEEAVEFVKQLERKKLPYLFVTNNSTKRPDQVAALLEKMGVPATSDHVFTTSMATASPARILRRRVYAIVTMSARAPGRRPPHRPHFNSASRQVRSRHW